MQEEWRAVVGYEGFYEVSNYGQIRSIGRRVAAGWSNRYIESRIRVQTVAKDGYLVLSLSAGRERVKVKRVHVIVLEAFAGPRPTPAHDGCHGDGNPSNNRLDNLRWGTKKENKSDSFLHGTIPHGNRQPKAKLTEQLVKEIRSDPRGCTTLAKVLGVSKPTILRARNRKTWKHVE